MSEVKRIFGCSPYRGDVETNLTRAKRYALHIVSRGHCPVLPHLFFPQFLDDTDWEEREKGIALGVELMKVCHEVWVYGTHISEGMAYELAKAKELGIPVRMFDVYCNRIDPATLPFDGRVNEDYCNAVRGLKFVQEDRENV